jgi:hypothetical protein
MQGSSIARLLLFWHDDESSRSKQMIVLAAYPLGCLLLIAALFARRRIVLVRVAVILIAVGTIFGVSELVQAYAPGAPPAVILERTKGHSGDGETYSVAVEPIVPGQEVRLLENRGAWRRVQLPDGKTCWVRAVTCEPV